MKLDELLTTPIASTTKGWPPSAGGLALGEVPRQGWNLLRQDLPLPVALLKGSAMARNSRWMRAFLERFEVSLYPHGKTSMAPQLFARQLGDGAGGITVATAQQLLVCRRFGVSRVLMANQLVGRQAMRAVLAEIQVDPGFEFTCLVDSEAGVEALAEEARAMGLDRPVRVLVEGGFAGGRTGCRSLEEALAVARSAAASPHVALVGIEGYEGELRRPTPGETEVAIDGFLDFLVELTLTCAREDLFAPGPIMLTAGGSKHFDQVARRLHGARLEREIQVVIRSGCYLTHDSKTYRDAFERLCARTPEVATLGPGLEPAIEIWAAVQSTPEPGLAIATMGKRDVAHDIDLPFPRLWFRPGLHERPQALGDGVAVTMLNDQHAYLAMPEGSPLQVGDLVGFGICHPCTTFDKWQLLHVVDDDYTVTESIRTFF